MGAARNRSEIFHSEKKCGFPSAAITPYHARSVNQAVVLTHAANATLDGQGICDPG